MTGLHAAGQHVYRNKLDHHKINICKTNTFIWKKNYLKMIVRPSKLNKIVFALMAMKKCAAQYSY